jgi:hypothetical protein
VACRPKNRTCSIADATGKGALPANPVHVLNDLNLVLKEFVSVGCTLLVSASFACRGRRAARDTFDALGSARCLSRGDRTIKLGNRGPTVGQCWHLKSRHTDMLLRSNYDQAARYLKYACELLERETPAQTRAIRKVLEVAVRRLSHGDNCGRCRGRDYGAARPGGQSAGFPCAH